MKTVTLKELHRRFAKLASGIEYTYIASGIGEIRYKIQWKTDYEGEIEIVKIKPYKCFLKFIGSAPETNRLIDTYAEEHLYKQPEYIKFNQLVSRFCRDAEKWGKKTTGNKLEFFEKFVWK